MIDKKRKLTDLAAILPTSVTSKFKKNKHVNTSTLEKICLFLGCQVQDVIEILPEPEPEPEPEPGHD
ncbi:MAG: helix-turn-helix domain-containing protein [Paludibacter sp.]|nr:helix-turn-helix domain-containing protein [Paludibacter sp.]